MVQNLFQSQIPFAISFIKRKTCKQRAQLSPGHFGLNVNDPTNEWVVKVAFIISHSDFDKEVSVTHMVLLALLSTGLSGQSY